eukprot:TRINITY_DN47122_c0_g1_i1.p1 TRINITY_DN47122_c0_g1~~TRINITY_DN47122_c0_g1_i1.p1  ORF type:complete len:292 (+),score=33.45 TRINITY_DN47122_c0_g1_i1:114-878(+)
MSTSVSKEPLQNHSGNAWQTLPVTPENTSSTARSLRASAGCLTCCGGGDCSAAFQGAQAGMCCGDRNKPYCCPATATCSDVFGQCLRAQKHTIVTQRTRTFSHPYHRRHESSFIGTLVVLLTLAAILYACYTCMKAQRSQMEQVEMSPKVQQGMPVGMGPHGQATVYGQPTMYGQSGSGNAALYGGAGFLGGLGVASMMMGPSWGGYGGYGGAYYGGEPYMTETTIMDTGGGGMFAADGGGFGGDGGGDFGGDF